VGGWWGGMRSHLSPDLSAISGNLLPCSLVSSQTRQGKAETLYGGSQGNTGQRLRAVSSLRTHAIFGDLLSARLRFLMVAGLHA
jgi:hypothetical protein